VAGALWSWATEHLSDPQLASPPPITGDAADMFPDAQRKGFQLAGQPAPGEIVVWTAGSFYGPYGHVGTVTAVRGDRFEVTEQNFPNDTSDVSAHWVPGTSARSPGRTPPSKAS
jgi:surface antigen